MGTEYREDGRLVNTNIRNELQHFFSVCLPRPPAVLFVIPSSHTLSVKSRFYQELACEKKNSL